MDPITIISTLEAAVKAGIDLYNEYEAGRVVLSETDLTKIKAALASSQALTAALAPKVDAALDAAAKV